MEWLETTVVVVHILVSLSLVGLVLMQQGKGAEAGASFGAGASQTVFGSQGSGSFLTRSTKYLAVIFFVTSVSLAMIAKEKASVAADDAYSLAPVEEVVSANKTEEMAEDGAVLELEAATEDQAAPELE